MKFSVQPAIFKQFPNTRLGVVMALGVNNKESQELVDLLRKQEKETEDKLKDMDLTTHEQIAPWREVYKQFGAKPSKYNSSVEALAKRVQKGQDLPDINPLVNLYNTLSLKYVMPFGGEDLDKVKGDIKLAFATGKEKGKYIGSDSFDTCEAGEVAYLDDLGFICRRWNWREGDRTKLTEETENVVLVAEALSPVDNKLLRDALEELGELVKKHLGGEIEVFYLDKDNTEFEIDFETGKKITPEQMKQLEAESVGTATIGSQEVAKLQPVKESKQTLDSGVAGEIQRALIRVRDRLEINLEIEEIILEHPAIEEHGDYSTNLALKLFGKAVVKHEYARLHKKANVKVETPRRWAEEIVRILEEDGKLNTFIEKIEVAGAGFVNFCLKSRVLVREVEKITDEKDSYGRTNLGQERLFGIEHTQPNTNKALHIGHVRNTSLGISLVRIMNFAGWDCKSWNINNDRGIHIVKSMWGYKNFGENKSPETYKKEDWLEVVKKSEIGNFENKYDQAIYEGEIKPDHFVGLFYLIGANKYENDEQAKKEMEQMLIDWEKGVPGIIDLWKMMNAWFYQGARQTLNRFGTYFDKEWYESKIYDKGKAIIELAVEQRKLHRAEDGHVEADLSQFSLPNVVLLRSNGTALYITQDIELARQRIQDDHFDYAMVMTGNEQNLRFQQLYRVCELLGIANFDQLLHLGFGMVRLKIGKMSSREGLVINADELIDEVSSKVREIMKGQESEADFQERVEKVVIGAIKYSMLKQGPLRDITFDIEESVDLHGDSGPYLQYTYARCRSVIEKSKIKNQKLKIQIKNQKFNNEEMKILRWIYRFPEIVEQAAREYAPNAVCTFLFELAQRYNTFYNQHSILGAESEGVKNFRLLLTKAVAQVLKNGLGLLGIEAPERM